METIKHDLLQKIPKYIHSVWWVNNGFFYIVRVLYVAYDRIYYAIEDCFFTFYCLIPILLFAIP